VLDGNDLLLAAIVPVVLIGLSWFLLRTEAGMAVRGMAENMDRARLLGIPVNQLSLLLWSIAGGLAALTLVLQTPNNGVPFDVGAGPTLLLPALAAAVASGMSSLAGAFAAGVAVSILDQLVQWNMADERSITSPVLLGVIVVALLVRRKTTSRRWPPTSRRGTRSPRCGACRGRWPGCPRCVPPSWPSRWSSWRSSSGCRSSAPTRRSTSGRSRWSTGSRPCRWWCSPAGAAWSAWARSPSWASAASLPPTSSPTATPTSS
jgi:hypothetical protein